MVVIGGMRSFLGPALGASVLPAVSRAVLDLDTDNWLLWFGLIFVGFVIFTRRAGLVGIWATRSQAPLAAVCRRRGAAMSRRQIHDGLPLPAISAAEGDFRSDTVLEVSGVDKALSAAFAPSPAPASQLALVKFMR